MTVIMNKVFSLPRTLLVISFVRLNVLTGDLIRLSIDSFLKNVVGQRSAVATDSDRCEQTDMDNLPRNSRLGKAFRLGGERTEAACML